MVEIVIVINGTGFENVKKFEVYAGKKLIDSSFVYKYEITVEKNMVMVFTYDNLSESRMHTHAFSADRVIEDFKVYVPKSVTEREERKKRREAKKAELENKEKKAKFELFKALFCNRFIGVESSNLARIHYSPNTKELRIIFKSNTSLTYVYHDVDIKVFGELLGAKSHGKYFNEYIKGKYEWEYE